MGRSPSVHCMSPISGPSASLPPGMEALEPRLLLAADWTVLVYMSADNNLEPYAIADLNEMEMVGSSGRLNILVQLDRGVGGDTSNGNWEDTRRGRVIQDSDPLLIGTPLPQGAELDMGNPNTLEDFITWGVSTYPAQRYALVLWGQGAGAYGLGQDDTSFGDALTIPELGGGLQRAGRYFDLVALQANLMGMLEPAYEIRNYAEYMVASEENIWGDSFRYDAWLTGLAFNPSKTPVDLAEDLVATYDPPYPISQTLSIVNLTQLGPAGLSGALDNFATTFMRDANTNDISLLEYYRQSARPFGGYDDFRDLGSILNSLATDNSITMTIRQAASTALAAYTQSIVDKYPVGTIDSTGMSIYLQRYEFAPAGEYLGSGTAFLADTSWNEFLTYWHQGLLPGRIEGNAWHDVNGNGGRDQDEEPLAGWTVFVDSNGNGQYDSPSMNDIASFDVPTYIFDMSSASSLLYVSDISGTITDVNVTLTIQHSWDADLSAYLISPAGTRVGLFNGVGGGGEGFTNTTLDDQAATAILSGAAPFTGRYRPQGYLSSLIGQDPNGTWRLEVSDNVPWLEGVLTSWSITLQSGDLATTTDLNGHYGLGNLAPGTYNVREVAQNQWYQTVPAAGGYSVVVAPGQTLTDIDFGNRRTVGRPDLMPGSDTGTYSDDDLTNLDNSSGSQRLQFQVPDTIPGMRVTVYADGTVVGTATAAVGTTSTVVTSTGGFALEDGIHEFQANQTDSEGNQTGLSVPLLVMIDTTAPIMTVNSLRTSDATPPLSGTTDDNLATVIILVGGQSHRAVNHGDTTWTLADDVIFPPLVGGIYNVRAEGTDVAGNTGHDVTSSELMLAVTISEVTGPAQTDEGTLETFLCDAVEPDGLTITYSWNFNDGTPLQTGTDLATIEHAFPDNGTFIVTASAFIASGQFDRKTFTIEVNNVSPTIVELESEDEFLRGQQGSILATVLDGGSADILTCTWDFGDGSEPVSGIGLFSPFHIYAEAGRYEVTLTVTDDDHGWASTTQTFPIWWKVVTPAINRSLEFVDQDLDHIRVTVTGGGSAEAFFIADTGTDLGRLVISGSTARTVVAITPPAGRTTSVGDIMSNRTLRAIIAPSVDFTGTLRVPQRAPLIQLRDVLAEARIDVGAALLPHHILASDGVNLRLRNIQDLSIDTHNLPLRSLTAAQWLDSDDVDDSIAAASVGSLRMLGSGTPGTGDFQADLVVSGVGLGAGAPAVAGVYIRGDLAGSTWEIEGPAASVFVGGDMIDSTIEITYDPDAPVKALPRLTILGLMSNSEVRSTGDIGVVVVGAMHSSSIYAGVADGVTGLPDPATDIYWAQLDEDQPARIDAVVVRGLARQGEYYSFADSCIAAYRVGQVIMTHADFFSQGTPFGVAAWEAGVIRYIDRDSRLNWTWTGRASQAIGTNDNMTLRLGVNALGSFTAGELVARDRIGDGGSTRTDLESLYFRAVGDWVYIGIHTLRPIEYSHLRLRILMDTLDGTDNLLYSEDTRSDIMVELNLDSDIFSLYRGGWNVPSPFALLPTWVDLWHPARWTSLPALSSHVVRTPEGLVLAVPKAAFGAMQHINLVSASLWTDAGAQVDTARTY